MSTERSLRSQIVDEARTWVKTPWHHMGRVKGAGVDCAQLLLAVYAAVGLLPEVNPGYYPPDWHLHQDRPRFLETLAQYAVKIDAETQPCLPGDVAMFKFGRHAAHGSIVLEWPLVIHASITERAVVITDVERHQDLFERLDSFWRLKGLT